MQFWPRCEPGCYLSGLLFIRVKGADILVCLFSVSSDNNQDRPLSVIDYSGEKTVDAMHYLVTGGGGYIGAHMARNLLLGGAWVTVVDNLSTGSMILVDALRRYGADRLRFVKADISDVITLRHLFSSGSYDAVFHLAASSVVGESMAEPEKYRLNNVVATSRLVDFCSRNRVGKFIFSSTASVYGEPGDQPAAEDAPLAPVSIYGETKLACEGKIIEAAGSGDGFQYMIFRFFNVAGACSDGRLGEVTPIFCHLIKAAARAALGVSDRLCVFGDDYPTPDGTGVRDYIHVEDIAAAHVAALDHLDSRGSNIFNVGYGRGCSVFQVIDMVRKVSGVDFNIEVIARRPGDPACLVADVEKIKAGMDWRPGFDDLEKIVRSAYEWEARLHQQHVGRR